jgi:hypothetical protein
VQGWNTIELNTPFLISNSYTHYIGYTLTTTDGLPLGTTNNTQTANVNYVQVGSGNWSLFSANNLGGNNAIIGVVTETPDTSIPASIPYSCGFEETAENSQWSLRNTAAISNPWWIGNLVANEGANALYISNWTYSHIYYSTRTYTYASRKLNFETQ